MATTLLSNLIDPQVMANYIDKKLTDNMVFAPLATIDTTLVGRPGDTITLPYYSYIGDAAVLGENSQLTCVALNASTVTATVKKWAKGVEITDEAMLSAYGDPQAEAGNQILRAIANKVDGEMLSVLESITGDMLYTTTATTVDLTVADIGDALEKFGEDVDVAQKILLCSPHMYGAIRKTADWLPASEISAERLVRGSVGEVFGAQIIVSNKLKGTAATDMGNAYLVMPDALRVFMKRDTIVETARDITYFKNIITASKHGLCYLYNTARAIKLMKKAA